MQLPSALELELRSGTARRWRAVERTFVRARALRSQLKRKSVGPTDHPQRTADIVRRLLLVLSTLMTQLPEPASAQRATAERAQLVVAILTIRSSYAANTQAPAEGRPDTIQWFIGAAGSWRVRTYATDLDIHVYATGALPADAVETARAHIHKHYGDVLQALHVLELPPGTTASTAQRILAQAGLPGGLEVARAGFAFVNMDGGQYRTKSAPR